MDTRQDIKTQNWFNRASFTFPEKYKGKHYDFPMHCPQYADMHFQTSGVDFVSFPLLMNMDEGNKLVLKQGNIDAFSYIRVDLFGDEKLKKATLFVDGVRLKVVEFFGDNVDTFRFCNSPLTFDPFTGKVDIEIEFFNDWNLGKTRMVMVGAFMAGQEIRSQMAKPWWPPF